MQTRLFCVLAALIAVGSLALAGSARAAEGDPSYLVTFAAGTSSSDQDTAIADAGGTDVSSIGALRLHEVTAPATAVDTLRANPAVASVEADKVRNVSATVSDPGFTSQWSLSRIGWDQLYGVVNPVGNSTVAVLDTGINSSHEDLAGKVVPGTSILDPFADGTSDPNGHGTEMAGIVAASADNGIGIAGIGYAGVKVMPVTVLNAGGYGQDSDIIQGVVWAADHGADVILMSFANPGYSPALQDAIDYAWSKGAVLVAAAGNGGSDTVNFPAGDRGVIGVANTDENDALAASSNYGEDVFMAAPGTNIATTSADGGYATISGTSAAAAAVAGSAALVKAADPSADNGVVNGRLARNADGVGAPAGNGRLNVKRAVDDAGTDPVQPAGAAPVGTGGPLVGPYAAAAANLTVSPSTTTAGVSGTITVTGGGGGNGAWPSSTLVSITDNGTPVSAVNTSNGQPCITASGNNPGYTCTYTISPAQGNHDVRAVAGSVDLTQSYTAVGAASQLAFTTQPSASTATGAAFGTQPRVTVQDSLGATVTSDNSTQVTLAIAPGTGTSGATLSCTGGNTKTVVAGVAIFSGCSIDGPGTGYQLVATSSPVLTSATSSAFTITGNRLVFTTSPQTVVAGAVSGTISIQLQNQAGTAVNATGTGGLTVGLTSSSGTGGFRDNATGNTPITTVTIPNGGSSASFKYRDTTAGSPTITAARTAGNPTQVFRGTQVETINNAADHLVFGVQPSTASSGATISPAVTVRVADAAGNTVTTDTRDITLAIGTNPSSGTLSGTKTVAAVAGVATFSDLSIDKAGTGYTLAASATSVTGATSSAFDITPGAAHHLAFSVQPSTTAAGSSITPAVKVEIRDANQNVVTSSSANVSLAIGTNPSSGTLSGTTTVAAVSGVATFSNVSINKVGTGYTLSASSGVLTGATSNSFDITPGAADHLAFSVQPSNTVAASSISPAVKVEIRDASDNVVTGSTANVTMAIGTNPGGGTLSGTTTQAAVAGVATFSNLSINKTGTGYTLSATSASLTGATSTSFNITPGAAHHLAFAQQPTDAAAAATITPAVTVRVLDANNNVVTSDTRDITLAIGTNPSSGTLSGTKTVAAVAGVATFSDLSINKAGTGYTLSTSSSPSLTGATSNAFNIAPAGVDRLVFGTQPSNAQAGAAITPAVTVEIQDAYGNVVTSDTRNVTLAIGTNPGSGSLSGTKTKAAVAGVATFDDLSINKVGTGYTLSASSSPSLTGATSNAFNITPGAAAKYIVSPTSPVSVVAGSSVPVTAQLADANDNPVPTSGVVVNWSSSAGSVAPAFSSTDVAGVAHASLTTSTVAGTVHTVTADDLAHSGTSANITTIAGAATKLRVETKADGTGVVVPAQSLASGNSITVYAIARDANNNFVANDDATWSLADATGGVVDGDLSAGTKSATFTGHVIGSAAIHAAESGLTSTDSGTITVVHGAASQVSLTGAETDLAQGVTRDFTATVKDASGNVVDDFNGNVSFAQTSGSGSVTGLGTQTAIAGAAVKTVTGAHAGSVTLRASASAINSNTRSFSVTNVAPSTPSLIAPSDNAATSDNTPAFDWSDSTDAGGDDVTYSIQAKLGSCTFDAPLAIDESGLASSAFTPSSALADGTYCWRVRSTDSNAADSDWSSTFQVTIDTVAPTVESIDLAGGTPTNQASVDWTVTFSEPVTGVDASDFALDPSSGISGAEITNLGGSGSVWTVTASTGSGDGTLGLNLTDDDSIIDVAANALAGDSADDGSFTGQSYTIDKTAPRVSSIARDSAAATNADTVSWTVTFSEDVSGVDDTDFSLAGSGLTGASITDVTGSGDSYVVTASTGTGDGTLGLNLADDDSIADAAGNALAGETDADGSFTGEVYTVDRTAPTISVSHTTDGTGDWNVTSPVTVTVTAADERSGLDGDPSCTDGSDPLTLTAGDPGSWSADVSGEGSHAISCSVSDLAGNPNSANDTVKIDTVAPAIDDLGPTSSPNADGWFNAPVTNRFEASDATSGIDSDCATAFGDDTPDHNRQSQTTNGESDHETVTSDGCSDNAGNHTGGVTSATFKVDATAPISSALSPTYNNDGSIHVTYSASDGLSGLKRVDLYAKAPGGTYDLVDSKIAVDAAHPVADSGSFDYTVPQSAGEYVQGTYRFYTRATDIADNHEAEPASPDTTTTQTLQDSIKPSLNVSHTANGAGWNNTNAVTLTVTASDEAAGSGLNSSSPSCAEGATALTLTAGSAGTWTTSVSGEGSHTVDCQATDNAGNQKTASDTVKIDTTSPTITDEGPTTTPDGQDSWYSHDVTNAFAASDTGSGLAASCLSSFSDSGNKQSKTTSGESDHEKVTSSSCADVAGNSRSGIDSATFKVDKSKPTTSDNVDSSWHNSAVVVTLDQQDGAAGSGVVKTYYEIGSSPATPTTSSPVYDSSHKPTLGNGEKISYFSVDKAGNAETPHTSPAAKVDTAAPSTTNSAIPAGWVNQDVTVTLTPSDTGGSGLDATNYYVHADGSSIPSGATWQTYSSGNKPVLGNGQVVTYYSTDVAHNEETPHKTSAAAKVDKVAPTVAVTGVTDGGTYQLGSVPAAGCSTNDTGGSGVKTNATVSVTGGSGGVGTFTATCSGAADNAGNAGNTAVATYKVGYNTVTVQTPLGLLPSLFKPIDNLPTLNTVKAGSAVPVKFSLHGYFGLNIIASGYPASQVVICGADATDPVEQTSNPSAAATLSYDATTDQYNYVWKTLASYANTCRQLVVKLNDDSTVYRANFKFSK